MIVVGALLIVIVGILIWFNIPYSPLRTKFKNDISTIIERNRLYTEKELFSEEEFENFPEAIQKFILNSGYIGTPKMNYMIMKYNDVDFMQGRSGPSLKIDYTQYNFVSEPSRMALIDSGLFGIPFEGYDYYDNGKGGTKGVIAKAITLFDQTGTDVDKACLVTYLAESLFAPTILLQDYIKFEEISDYEIKATITYKDQTASGIFTFNEQYEMISFVTNDRVVANSDGTMEYVPWTAQCGEYRVSNNGIKYPTKFQAVWNYSDGDFIYFDGVISEVSYGF